jgi:hypothetical protein
VEGRKRPASGGTQVVVVNAEKPGKGNFVVRVKGTPVVELLGMKRPFPALKVSATRSNEAPTMVRIYLYSRPHCISILQALDMDQVCKDVFKAMDS